MPLVSVAIPVYNAQSYLKPALESVLSQSWTDFEVLCVDDGSTDQSLEILRAFERSDPRVRVISRPNTGIVGALNDALEISRGEFVARMDGDDLCHPHRFAEQVAYLEQHQDCVAVGSRVLLIDPQGAPLRLWSTCVEHDAIDAEHLRGNGGAITHPASMLRKSALVQVGLYRQECQLAEDLDLFLRLAEIGRLANLETTLLSWRMHLASTGSTRRVAQSRAALRAVTDAFRRRGLAAEDLPKVEVQEQTVVQIRSTWAWWALAAGHTATARKHAWAAFLSRPLEASHLKLLYCAARGY